MIYSPVIRRAGRTENAGPARRAGGAGCGGVECGCVRCSSSASCMGWVFVRAALFAALLFRCCSCVSRAARPSVVCGSGSAMAQGRWSSGVRRLLAARDCPVLHAAPSFVFVVQQAAGGPGEFTPVSPYALASLSSNSNSKGRTRTNTIPYGTKASAAG